MNKQEARSLLHLPNKFSSNMLKLAYRKCAAKSHPDKGGTDDDMKKTNEAYGVLSKYTSKIVHNKDVSCDIKQFLRREMNITQSDDGNYYIPIANNMVLVLFTIKIFNDETWILSHVSNSDSTMCISARYSIYKELPKTETSCDLLRSFTNKTAEEIIQCLENK